MEKILYLCLIASLIAATISFLLSFCFLFISVPQSKSLVAYRKSRILLSIAYLILGIGNASVLLAYILQIEIDTSFLFPIFASIASAQAFLFTTTLITLLDAEFVRKKQIIIRFALIILYLTLAFTTVDRPIVSHYINLLFYIYYILQLCHHTLLFFKKDMSLRKRLNDCYADDKYSRMNWIRISFLAALAIGISVAITLLFISFHFLLCLIFIYSLFYVWFAIHYLNYPILFAKMKDGFTREQKEAVASIPYHQLTEIIDKWIEEKHFLLSGITLNQLAADLNTNRTYLSSYINSTQQTNFNHWINTLRIKEAIQLMQEHPNWSINRISDETGFSDSACFSRQFKRITGTAPRLYKKQYEEVG
ncbi:AraC family transcriptional regulator [Bacteroides sp. OttesenSCG-928-F21]|nr:AraC family transcriptional regulator [Bacteroides sp. OttesenSCG-928-F21]